jgi:hypothetical protein
MRKSAVAFIKFFIEKQMVELPISQGNKAGTNRPPPP